MLFLFFAAAVQDFVCGDRRAALVPQHNVQSGALLQLLRQSLALFGARANRAVHILRVAEDDLLNLVFLNEGHQLVHQLGVIPLMDDARRTGKKAGRIGDRKAGAGVSVINAQNTHSHTPVSWAVFQIGVFCPCDYPEYTIKNENNQHFFRKNA